MLDFQFSEILTPSLFLAAEPAGSTAPQEAELCGTRLALSLPTSTGSWYQQQGSGRAEQIASPPGTALPQPRGSPRALLGALQLCGQSRRQEHSLALRTRSGFIAGATGSAAAAFRGHLVARPQRHKEQRARDSSCLCKAPAEVVGRILHTQSPRIWGMVIKKPGEQCLTLSKCFLVVIQRSKENPEENTW